MSDTDKAWKAILIDYDLLENMDDDNECTVCLSTREMAILKALLMTAYWPTRWLNLGDTPDELNARMSRLDLRLDTCINVGGDTWMSIYNLNLLFQYINAIKWDGDTTSINPDAPVDAWNYDEGTDGNDALCMGVQDLVKTMAGMELSELYWRNEGIRKPFFDLLQFTGDILGLGFTYKGTLIAGDSWDEVKEAMEDPEAIRKIACCLFNNLRGENVTQAVLADGLDGCGFAAGTKENLAAKYIRRNLDGTETYYALIDAVGNAYVRATVLNQLDCLCSQIGIVTFDDPVNDLGYSHEYGEVSWDNGNPKRSHKGEFWSDTKPYGRRTAIRINLTEEMTIKGVHFDFYHKAAANHDLRFLVTLYDSSLTQLDQWDETWTTDKEIWSSTNWYPWEDDVQFIDVDLMFNVSENLDYELFLDNVRVLGGYS